MNDIMEIDRKTQKTHGNKKQHVLRERWEYRLGTVSEISNRGFKPGLRAFYLTLIPSVPYKTNRVNKYNPRPRKLQHQQRQNSM